MRAPNVTITGPVSSSAGHRAANSEDNGIFEFTPTRTLTDRAYETLEELIVTLRLAPGDVISETALSDRLDIGRTPVREALQRLAREGLVRILPRKGILVTEINPRSQLLLEVRRELERLLARTGAVRATRDERVKFREIAEGMRRAERENDELGFMRLDDALNKLIATAAHNEYANRAIGLTHGCPAGFGICTTSRRRTCRSQPVCTRIWPTLLPPPIQRQQLPLAIV